MECNGKEYPLWGQFVERQNEFIGKALEDHNMGIVLKTKVTGISLKPNGRHSAFFSVHGENFTCGFDVRCGGISAGKDGWITFSGYGGHEFRVRTGAEV